MDMPLVLPFMQQLIMIFIALVIVGAATSFFLIKKFRLSRKIWFIILPLPSLTAIYIIFYIVSNFIGRAEVNSELEKMRQAGIPTSIKELIPDSIDQGNDAAIFYEKAFGILKDSQAYSELENLRVKEDSCEISKWEGSHRTTAAYYLESKEFSVIFKLLKDGTGKPFTTFIRQYDPIGFPIMELQQEQRSFFRLLCIKASCEAFNRDWSNAYALLEEGFKMLEQLRNERDLISALTNMACISISTDTLNGMVIQYEVIDKIANKFINYLDNIDLRKMATDALWGEFILYGRNVFQVMTKEKLSVFNIFNDKPKKKWYFITSSPFIYQDYAYSIRYRWRLSELFKEPYWTAKGKIEVMKIEVMKIEVKNKPFIPFTRFICLHSVFTFREKVAKIESEIEALKLTLALHIYKNTHGQFPEKLDALSPEILKKIPCDPFNGKPFEYKKEGNYFTLSSEWLIEKEKIGQRPRRNK